MFSFFPFIMTVSGYNNELPLSPFNKETLRLERERVLKNTQSVHCPGICPVYYVQFNERMTEKVNKVVKQIQRKRTLFYLTCSNAVRIFLGNRREEVPLSFLLITSLKFSMSR